MPRSSIDIGWRGYLRYRWLGSLRSRWGGLRAGPRLERRPPLRYAPRRAAPSSRRALVAYLREPFEAERRGGAAVPPFHVNVLQALRIRDALVELGYAVDVLGPLDDPGVLERAYDLLIGELGTFTRCLPAVKPGGVKLYYATRNHPLFEQRAVHAHLEELRARTGPRLWNPLRESWYREAARGIEQADAVIAIGGELTASTYADAGKVVVSIGNSALFHERVPLAGKDVAAAARHFLWLGSGPLANKGLARVLGAFANHPHLQLWVCGPLESPREAGTVWALRRRLFDTANVHPVGWIDVQSDRFTTMLETCGWIVSASCSDAMASSVVLGVANGLVPIVNRETGLDCEPYGLLVEPSTDEELAATIARAAAMAPEEVERRARAALAAARERFTLDAFQRSFTSAVLQLAGPGSHA